ncbi:MAG: glycosyltransferase [Clostridia bacterium]
MKVLFLGYAVNKCIQESNDAVSVAGNKFQCNLIKELDNKEAITIQCISVYPIASYPTNNKFVLKKQKIKLTDNINTQSCGFINVPIIKQVMQIIGTYNLVKNISKDTKVLTFNLFPQIGIPAILLKMKKNVNITCIWADPPIDDDISNKGKLAFVYNVYYKLTEKIINKYDNFIVLNKYVIDKYCPNKKYIVIEGACDLSEYSQEKLDLKIRKNIVYTGALSNYSGIERLVKAMELVSNKDIVLEIYGNGILKEWIIEHQSSNIIYKGSVTNREILEIQSKAWLLINPRNIDDEIAKNTFPSKIFEYMMSGTPVLSTKLNGFTEDYLDKMFFMDNNDVDTISKSINFIDSLDEKEMKYMAQKAKDFIAKEKNWNVQCEKIRKFLLEESDD